MILLHEHLSLFPLSSNLQLNLLGNLVSNTHTYILQLDLKTPVKDLYVAMKNRFCEI